MKRDLSKKDVAPPVTVGEGPDQHNTAPRNGKSATPVRSAGGTESVASTDEQLVQRCRDGDEEAWSEIHAKCHSHVMRQIRYSLGVRGRDDNLVEELAARVWYGLLSDDTYLLGRFQPTRARGLEKYLAAIARFEVLRHQRSEFRRKRREQQTQSARTTNGDDATLRDMTIDVNSFLPSLTPREKEFFHHVLMGNNGHHMRISAPNAWQLKHRIQKKLLEFLDIPE